MRFIQDYVSELAPRRVQNRFVFKPEEHVFQHGDVRHQYGRRTVAKSLPVDDFLRPTPALDFLLIFERSPVIQGKANFALEWRGPVRQSLTLAVYQRVQGIEHDRLNADHRLTGKHLPNERIQ